MSVENTVETAESTLEAASAHWRNYPCCGKPFVPKTRGKPSRAAHCADCGARFLWRRSGPGEDAWTLSRITDLYSRKDGKKLLPLTEAGTAGLCPSNAAPSNAERPGDRRISPEEDEKNKEGERIERVMASSRLSLQQGEELTHWHAGWGWGIFATTLGRIGTIHLAAPGNVETNWLHIALGKLAADPVPTHPRCGFLLSGETGWGWLDLSRAAEADGSGIHKFPWPEDFGSRVGRPVWLWPNDDSPEGNGFALTVARGADESIFLAAQKMIFSTNAEGKYFEIDAAGPSKVPIEGLDSANPGESVLQTAREGKTWAEGDFQPQPFALWPAAEKWILVHAESGAEAPKGKSFAVPSDMWRQFGGYDREARLSVDGGHALILGGDRHDPQWHAVPLRRQSAGRREPIFNAKRGLGAALDVLVIGGNNMDADSMVITIFLEKIFFGKSVLKLPGPYEDLPESMRPKPQCLAGLGGSRVAIAFDNGSIGIYCSIGGSKWEDVLNPQINKGITEGSRELHARNRKIVHAGSVLHWLAQQDDQIYLQGAIV